MVSGNIGVGSVASMNTVAMWALNGNQSGAYVNGLYLSGVFHPGSAPPPDLSQNQPDDIIVTGGPGGYWTFEVDNTGLVQNDFLASGYNAYLPADPSPVGGGGTFTPISSTVRQQAIDLLSGNNRFRQFRLNGVDIGPAILNAIATNKVVFTDRLPANAALTNTFTRTIYLSTSYQNNPVALALVLAHEGLHQALFDLKPHGPSIYEEALGRLVSAYAMSGLSAQNLTTLRNNPSVYADLTKVKTYSDQGDFAGLMQYVRSLYGAIPQFPNDLIYDIIKGSF